MIHDCAHLGLCDNCRAFRAANAEQCKICEYPFANHAFEVTEGMTLTQAFFLKPGDRFRWDGETWFVKSINPAIQRGEPVRMLDGTAAADCTRTALITCRPGFLLVSTADIPEAPLQMAPAKPPTLHQKLNHLQAQNRLLVEQMTEDHRRYSEAFTALEDTLRAFQAAVVTQTEEYRVNQLIQSELLATQTVQMHQMMIALQVDGTGAMVQGHKLARTMMEKAGVDPAQIELRQKVRAEILKYNGYTDEPENTEHH